MRMALTGLVAGIAIALAAVSAQAQNGTPETEDARYSFHRVDDGYLRLDVRSGQVSLCSRRAVGWACHPIPDERAALEERDRAPAGRQCRAEKGHAGARICRCRARSSRSRRWPRFPTSSSSCRAMPTSTA